MKIKSKLLRAAQHCQAVNDVRTCLNGIHINRKYIQATNRHILIQMEHGSKVRSPITVTIKGKVPAGARLTKFAFGKDGGTDALAKHYDSLNMLISVQTVTLQSGSFPDFEVDDLLGDMDKFSSDNPTPPMNVHYTALTSKMFKGDKFMLTRPLPSGPSSAVLFEFSELIKQEYGNPKFLVMPSRWY